jgi:hypothetical protein
MRYNEIVHQLLIGFKKAYDSVGRKVLYNILTVFGVTMKLVGPIKMCLKETYSKVHKDKYLSCMFSIQNGLKKGDAFQLCLEYAIRKGQETMWD